MVKLHLGCGKRFLKDFIHIDLADLPHIDHRHDIKTLPMFEDESVDLIYAPKCFQYFTRQEALGVLKEWRRVLKIGGTLRLSVPDFPALVKVYQQTNNLSLIHGPLYGIIQVGGKMMQHGTVYDFPSLSTLLLTAGFHHIRHWNWQKALPQGYDDCSIAYIPHLDIHYGILVSLNVEADRSSWVY